MTADFARTRNIFVVGFTITVLGTGFVYPLTAVFLNRVYDLSAGKVALYFALVAGCAFASGPVAGVLADTYGALGVSMVGIFLQTLGPLLVGVSSNATVALCGAAILGTGNGVFFGAQTPLFVSIFGTAQLPRIFALEYMVMNIAVATAGASSGVIVGWVGEVGFRAAFVINGITFAVYGGALGYLARSRASTVAGSRADTHEKSKVLGWGAVRPVSDSRFLVLLLIYLILTGFGFAQMDAVLPLVLTASDTFPLAAIGAFLAVNGIAVVVLQPWATPVVERIGFPRSISATALAWLGAFGVGFLAYAMPLPTGMRLALLMCFAISFAIGEVFLAPAAMPLAVQLAPEGRLGTYSASMATVYNVGLMLGPLISLPLFGIVGGTWYWLIPGSGLLVAALLTLFWGKLRRSARVVELPERMGQNSG